MTYQACNVYDYLQKPVDRESVDNCVDGKCSCCGSCCTNFLALSDAEICRIKKYIRKHDIKPCSHGFTAPLTVLPVDMICPFRDEEKKICTIYEARPFICRHYRCNKTVKEFFLEAFKEDPGYARRKRSYINMRLTFFGAENMEDQIKLTRVMAMKQKAAFGSHTDEWL